MVLEKRSLIIGFFISEAVRRTGSATQDSVNELCSAAKTTPLSLTEAREIKDFLDFVADVMERNTERKSKR